MKASILARSLKLAAQALAQGDALPTYKNFHIADGILTAANGVMSISTVTDLPIKAVPDGALLTSIISSFGASELSFGVNKKGNVTISSGKSDIEVATIPFDNYTLPELSETDAAANITDTFMAGIAMCKDNCGCIAGYPFQMGVIVTSEDNKIVLYATDNITLSRYETGMAVPNWGLPAILPRGFCDIISDAYVTGESSLSITENELSFFIGDVTEINSARIIGTIPDLAGVYAKSIEGSTFSIVTDNMVEVLERSCMLATDAFEKVSITRTATALTFNTQTPTGIATESVQLKNKYKLDALHVTPSALLKGIKLAGEGAEISITNECSVTRYKAFAYVTAALAA